MSEEQEQRWQETIAGLVESESFLPPFETVKPFYRMCDRSHVWKIRFEDGRIGWARIDHNFYRDRPTYYVPADIANDATIRWLIACGVKQEHARNPVKNSLANDFRSVILSVTPDQWERLAAESSAMQAAPLVDPEFPRW